jgi:predicted membrane-bound spermidine synthase
MNKENFKYLMFAFLILVFGCSIFAFISPNLTPLVKIAQTVTYFTPEHLVSGDILALTTTLLAGLFLYQPKIFLKYFIPSALINIGITYLIKHQMTLELAQYALTIATLSPLAGVLVEGIKTKDAENKSLFKYVLLIGILPIAYGMVIMGNLYFGVYTIPTTNDIQAIFIDSYLHIPHAPDGYLYFISSWLPQGSMGYSFFNLIYQALTIGIIFVAFMEFKYRHEQPRYYIHTLMYVSAVLFMGVFLYNIYPVMGPAYLKGIIAQNYPHNLNWMNYLGLQITGSENPRNGMPSMHIGLSLFLFLNSRKAKTWIKWVTGIFFILTATATLVLGEHYIIDWFGALPVIILGMSFAAIEVSFAKKWKIIRNNVIFLAFWYVFLWHGVDYLSNWLGCWNCTRFNISMTLTVYGFILISTALSYFSYKKLMILGDEYYSQNQQGFNSNIELVSGLKQFWQEAVVLKNHKAISALFVLSGMSALIYQIVFGKLLSVLFGNTALTMVIVLATLMAGIALGSWIGSREKSLISPILKFAFCELSLATYCLLSPFIINLISHLYIAIATHFYDSSWALTIIKIIAGVVCLIIPATLIGLGTPVLLKNFDDKADTPGYSITHLYVLNTLGAVAGSLLASYILIDAVGVRNTIFSAVLINFIIGLQAIQMFKKQLVEDEEVDANELFKDFVSHCVQALCPCRHTDPISKTTTTKIALTLLFITGLIGMNLQVLFFHGLSIVSGSSTYTVAIMLSIFLAGLSAGGLIAKKMIAHHYVNEKLTSVILILMAFSLLVSWNLFNLIPVYLGSFETSKSITLFVQKEFIRAMTCFAVMILPAIFNGMAYACLMNLLSPNETKENKETLIGLGLTLNALGNAVGVILGSFVLVNIFGISLSLKILMVILALSALTLYLVTQSQEKGVQKIKNLSGILLSLIIFIIVPLQLNWNQLTSGSSIYLNHDSKGMVVAHIENINAGLVSINKMQNKNHEQLSLLTDGKLDSNNGSEINYQKGFAIIPLMHLLNNDNALMIGYGTGVSASVIHDSGFKHIDIIDNNQGTITLANQYFSTENKQVFKAKNINMIIDDGRSFLQLSGKKKYDLMSVESNAIWFNKTAYLYNREFYALAKQHLTENGIFEQSVQMHHTAPEDFLMIINTIRSEFRYVNIYSLDNQAIIIATNSEQVANPDREALNRLNNNHDLNEMKKIYQNDFITLVNTRLLDSAQTDKLISNVYGNAMGLFYSTDNNLALEYSTAKGNDIKQNTIPLILKLLAEKSH